MNFLGSRLGGWFFGFVGAAGGYVCMYKKGHRTDGWKRGMNDGGLGMDIRIVTG